MTIRTTTIQVPVKLKKELDAFKDHKNEPYADVISKLICIVREDEESKLELSGETLAGIREAREDMKAGRVFSSKQIKEELGL